MTCSEKTNERRLKILYVIKRTDRSGMPIHVLQLLRHFNKTCDVTLVYGINGYLQEQAEDLGIEAIKQRFLVSWMHIGVMLLAIVSACSLLRKARPDLVHAHGPAVAIIWRVACWISGVPCVVTVQGWNFDEGLPLMRRIAALLPEYVLRFSPQQVIVVSNHERELALSLKATRPNQIRTIYNGISDRESTLCTSGRVPKLIMAARFEPQKSQDELIKVMATIEHLEWELMFAGEGETQPTVERMVARSPVSNCVQFLGHRSDVPDLLDQSDIFLLISKYEGLPLSIVEAMRASMPAVVSDVGGNSEAVEDGVTGYVVPVGDEEMLRSRIAALIESEDLRKAMGIAARQRYERLFSEEKMTVAVDAIYEKALGRGH